jgi:hypothetical protein
MVNAEAQEMKRTERTARGLEPQAKPGEYVAYYLSAREKIVAVGPDVPAIVRQLREKYGDVDLARVAAYRVPFAGEDDFLGGGELEFSSEVEG